MDPCVENHDQSRDDCGGDIRVWQSSWTHLVQKIGISQSLDDGMGACDQEKASEEQKYEFFFTRP
jgi:hypothetical protein